MAHVTVMSRQGCGLCAQAERAVERICVDEGATWSVTDVDTDPELRAEYGDQVPVLLVDGVEHGYWTVDESRLRQALSG
ncbi:glutaredoxin family protein [Haloechinothrix sp. LS1_15]|uniref:glutaredoxin family protein n=1 Tax=Haloechinothrix sp. LS1_15 TaxID=2652248 RepID=UPI00294633B5|nr:glutaredoxin family protein [Haloechinothrix sp. LS1_15]MDV6012629.1 glutaredoxin family protein [Haloechinothrix sp. LS1_15]